MKSKLILFLGLALLGSALSATPTAAQTQSSLDNNSDSGQPTVAQLQWSPASDFDTGQQTDVAVYPSGLVLEFHKTDSIITDTLWYHVGRWDGNTVNWGGSQRLPVNATWPNVAVTKEGYVLFVWSTGLFKSSSGLQYMVGKIDPDGSVNQSIIWLTEAKWLDSGFHSSIAINEKGVIVEVHESGSGGEGLYYRVGRLANPAGGDFNIIWESGAYGQHYDDGINPHIAINNLNQVVEVHQVTGEDLQHYHRGIVLSSGIIDFRGSQRYENNGYNPSVALLDNGLVLELHADDGIYARTGILSQSNPALIDWTNSVKISGQYGPTAIATNGTQLVGPHFAVGTWSSNPKLYFSVAQIR